MKTVRVRAIVLVAPDGRYNVVGWSDADIESMLDAAYSGADDFSGEVRHFIEADIPLPDPQTVKATIVKGGAA